jgi:hypothetical protein
MALRVCADLSCTHRDCSAAKVHEENALCNTPKGDCPACSYITDKKPDGGTE